MAHYAEENKAIVAINRIRKAIESGDVGAITEDAKKYEDAISSLYDAEDFDGVHRVSTAMKEDVPSTRLPTPHPGFQLNTDTGMYTTFENGVTVNVFFGVGSDTDNKMNLSTIPGGIKSENAELGIWDSNGEWITQEFSGSPFGPTIPYASPADLVKALVWAEAYTAKEE